MVESEEGRGSRFTISLPSSVRAHTISPQAAPSPPQSPAPAPRGSRRVLVVDDNPANVRHVRDFLESKGHQVMLAYSGQEGLDHAQSLPDIVFMDVQMPGMDGIETTRRLRADPHTRDLHIVALTSLAMGEDREKCLRAGANDYLSKPISLRTLLETVERLEDVPS